MPKNNDEDFEQAVSRVAQALKAWHTPIGGMDDSLIDFLIVQEIQQNHLPTDALPRSATNQILLAGIEELAQQESQLAQVLKLRFVKRQKLWAVANTMAISEQTVSRLQKKGIRQLAQIIHGRELAKREQLVQQMEATLPPATYTQLFGIEETGRQLLSLLEDPDGPAVIAIVGLGGIGKTALTDMTVRQMIPRFHFHKVIWLRISRQTLSGHSVDPKLTFETLLTALTAQLWPGQSEQLSPQQRLVKLRQELNTSPHLIVIDNLESQTDATYILDQLHGFTRPTKFLLTSRSRLTEQSAVFNLRLTELSFNAGADFVRYHAQECGILSLAIASDSDIADIYEVTGGNPLALKLVVSLLEVLPLSEIVADMTETRTNSVEGMYRHIYQQAWHTLSDNGRVLLQAMPLVSESGGKPDYLATVSGLSPEQLWPALHELHNRSLIEVRGSIHEKRYGIHRLTYSFLCTEIIHLPEW